MNFARSSVADRDDYVAFASSVGAARGRIHLASEDGIDFDLIVKKSQLGGLGTNEGWVSFTSGQGPLGPTGAAATNSTGDDKKVANRNTSFMVCVARITVLVVDVVIVVAVELSGCPLL